MPKNADSEFEPQAQADGRQPNGQAATQHVAGQQYLKINGAQNQRGQDGERIDQYQRGARQRGKASGDCQRR